MRRAKIYAMDVEFGDRISRTREGDMERVFRSPRRKGIEGTEISTSAAGVETTRTYAVTRMVWIEIH